MKKNILKTVAVSLAATLAIGLVGCGADNRAESNTDPAPAEDTAAAEESAPAEDTAPAENTESAEDSGAAADDYSADLPSDYAGNLTMWGWDDPYFAAITTAFQAKYPNVTFEYTPMANADTLQKYQTALAAGTELPDVAWSIIDSRAKVHELDMWEDLSAAPYNFDINGVYDYLHYKMVNSKGQVCTIEQSLSPAGLAYRKDLALQYLGTDDPAELNAMMPTWEDFAAKGQEVYEQSGGAVFMMQSPADAMQFVREQNGTSWIDGTTVNATAALKRSLDMACLFRDNNVTDKLESWSPAWYASFGEGKHIFAGCAGWSVQFNIVPNDPAGEAAGHWGLMSAPEGNISWGGTSMGISKTCADKRLAWEFIKFATISTEGAEALNSIGLLTTAKAPYEENPALQSFTSPWFGDQDLGKFYLEEVIPNIQSRPMNFDDNVVHESLNLVTTALNNDPSITAEDAMAQLIEELEMKLPDYTVE